MYGRIIQKEKGQLNHETSDTKANKFVFLMFSTVQVAVWFYSGVKNRLVGKTKKAFF